MTYSHLYLPDALRDRIESRATFKRVMVGSDHGEQLWQSHFTLKLKIIANIKNYFAFLVQVSILSESSRISWRFVSQTIKLVNALNLYPPSSINSQNKDKIIAALQAQSTFRENPVCMYLVILHSVRPNILSEKSQSIHRMSAILYFNSQLLAFCPQPTHDLWGECNQLREAICTFERSSSYQYGMYTVIGYGGQIQRWRAGTFTTSVYGPDPGHRTRLSYTAPYYAELLLLVIVHRFQA